MVVQRLLELLNQNHIDYSTVKHSPAYTALSSAKSARISGNEMVKSILLKLDGSYTLAVLPSTSKIDFKRLKEITGSQRAALADEEDLENIFPDCTTGAMPPLGNLYQIPVISDELITKQQNLFFEGGSHREIVRILYSDYLKLAHPKIANIHRN